MVVVEALDRNNVRGLVSGVEGESDMAKRSGHRSDVERRLAGANLSVNVRKELSVEACALLSRRQTCNWLRRLQ